MRVQVYRNLHKECWSVVALEGEPKGRVIGHSKFLELEDVTFVVQPAGRKRVLEEKRKNVHAFVRGTMVQPESGELWEKVKYNPYKYETIVDMGGDPVYAADSVFMNVDGGVYALNPRG